MSLARHETAQSQIARAKVNLTLHVGRVIRDADAFHGYHPLDSLVVFADFGDALAFEAAEKFALEVGGPFGAGLEAGETNLVSRAVRASERLGAKGDVRIKLEKHLPIASGMGGGSADAAAVLRALAPEDGRLEAALSLGADVPACVLSRTLRMTGIGESVTALPGLGQVHAVLANPGVGVSTAEIFKRFDAPSGRDDWPRETPRPQADTGTLLERARDGRNDLEPVAVELEPRIGELIDLMGAQAGCDLARMTGSGATVFGLFGDDVQASTAADAIAGTGLWARACRLGDR